MKKLSLFLTAVFILPLAACTTTTTTSTEDTEVKVDETPIVEETKTLTDEEAIAYVDTFYDDLIRMDTHLHVDVDMNNATIPADNIKEAMENVGINAAGAAFAVDYIDLPETGMAYDRFHNALDAYDKYLEQSNMTRALSATEMKEKLENGEPVFIQTIEGAHFLEGDTSRMQEAYDRGVRILDLFHDNHANPSLGNVTTHDADFGGLTEFGKEAIKATEDAGILVDLNHAATNTLEMALEVVTKPFMVSHTALVKSFSVPEAILQRFGTDNPEGIYNMMVVRYIDDDMAKKIVAKGGLIGVWPQFTQTPDEYAQRIKDMIDVVGIDNVTLATDSKITSEYMEGRGETGYKDKELKVNHVWDNVDDNFYHATVVALAKLGYTKDEIYKICGGNFFELFEKITG